MILTESVQFWIGLFFTLLSLIVIPFFNSVFKRLSKRIGRVEDDLKLEKEKTEKQQINIELIATEHKLNMKLVEVQLKNVFAALERIESKV